MNKQVKSIEKAPATSTNKAEAQGKQKTEKPLPVAVELVPLSEVKVGSVIRYESSKKPYIVAEAVTRGEAKGLLLVSMPEGKIKGQQYEARQLNQRVVVLHSGNGIIPSEYGDKQHEKLRVFTNKYLKERQAAQEKAAKARAEREAAAKVKAESETKAETSEK